MVVFFSPAKLHKCSCNSVAKFMTNCIGCLLTSTRCKRRRTFGFYDNRDNRDNCLIVNSMLSVDNNKNNFYQPKGWLPLEIF